MKYTFYRPNELNTTEFDKIISDMHDVLVRISNGYADGNELKDYLEKLIRDQNVYKAMQKWGFGDLMNPKICQVMQELCIFTHRHTLL